MNNKLSRAELLLVLGTVLVLFASAQSSNSLSVDTARLGKNKITGKYIHTRGFNMYYETYGRGEPLLFIHGNGGSIKSWINQIPYFSKRYKVIAADSRAQGKSADLNDSISYEMMADDLNAMLDTLHLDSCYVVGWSDGGINGLLLAMRHPDKVRKLAVTGANLWPDSTAIDPFFYKVMMKYNDTLKKMPLTPKLKHERKLMHLIAEEPHIEPEQLHSIQCPTLVMGGDHDLLLPRHTLLIAESIPRFYLWILPNSGHSTPLHYKDQFNAVVRDFFKKPYRKIEGMDREN